MQTAQSDSITNVKKNKAGKFFKLLPLGIWLLIIIIILLLLNLFLSRNRTVKTPTEESSEVTTLPRTGSSKDVGTVEGTLNMAGNSIVNVGPAQQDSDAVSRGGADDRFVNVTGDTMIGDLTISGGKDLILASSGDLLLNDTYLNESTSPTDSGAFLIGVYDEFDNSNSYNVQDVLDDLDLAISSLGGGDGSYTETDPIFSASPAHGITNTLISRWNTAYGWGNHASAGYITSESDPIFSASPSAGITSGNISNWNTAYSWGNHATVGYLTSEGSDPIWVSAEPNYFNLSQNETVNGIPAFNGGQSGVSAPFSVDSTYIVSNLNSNLLDNQDASFYLNASNINSGTLGNAYFSAYFSLSAESYLNNDSDSDLLIRSQSDSRFINDGAGEIDNSNDFNFPSSTFISNLDTDYLDGQHGSYFLNASNVNSGTLGNSYFSAYSNLFANSYVPASSSTIWTNTNDGTGSGLDADTLDGSHASSFMSASTDDWVDEIGDTISGTLTFSSVATDINVGSNEDLTLSAPGNGHIILLPDTGNVGIGTTSPSDFKLQVNGSIGPNSAPTISSISQTATAIDTTNNYGSYSSIAIGTDGLPIVSHFDDTNDDLRVCKCTNTSCTSATCTTIDSTNDVGPWTSIAVGSDNLAIISFRDITNADLRVCKCNNSSCVSATCSTIDSTGSVGMYTSIALGTDGLAIISHFNGSSSYLRVCKCSNSTCSSATCSNLDTSSDAGQHTSIAIGTDGLPVISHSDNSNYDLRVCKCSNTSCTSATCSAVDTTNNVGKWSSIAMGTEGLPIISHFDDTNDQLRVCKCNNTSCTTATCNNIDSTYSLGDKTSITIGTDGLPIISHVNATYDLRVCKCQNTSCSTATCTTVDSANNVGFSSSIKVGTEGLPVISHNDSTNGDLRVVKCATENCANTSGSYYNGGSDLGSRGKYFNNVYAVNYWVKEGMQISNFDLAEDYKAIDLSITAGDVVAPTYGSNISIDKTKLPYQNNVIGVISTKPGLKLSDWNLSDEERELMRPVALAGRVPVKVTTENGPIKKDDLLVPASKPGFAMKACGEKYCQAGTIVGKALEDFNPYQTGDSEQVTSELQEAEAESEQRIANSGQLTSELTESKQEIPSRVSDNPSLETKLTKPVDTSIGEGRIMMFVNLSWYNPPNNIPDITQGNSNFNYSFTSGNLDTIDSSYTLINISADTGIFKQLDIDNTEVTSLNVTGLLTSNQIKTRVFEAYEAENITIILSETLGKTAFAVEKSLGETIFEIDSTGKISLKEDNQNPSIGKEIIKAGETSVRIDTNTVTGNSKIFITPTVTTHEQLAVTKKAENRYFIVKIEKPLTYDLIFDWWLIN